MEKRNFLKLSTLTAAGLFMADFKYLNSQTPAGKIKPQALAKGDSIRIIAPGTAVSDPDDILKAEEILRHLELNPIYSENFKKGSGYKTRTVKERVEDIHEAFLDKNSKGIFCIRGGYGTPQLIDSIDYDIIKNNPKVFCGYSDITALHSAINKLTGLITFHSPVLLSAFTAYTHDIFVRMLFNNTPFGLISNPDSNSGLRSNFPIRTIHAGSAEGEIIGGNLSLISSLVGTKFQINCKNKILALEETGEPPYRIDRMLNQLRLAGMLDDAAGIIFGRCTDCSAGLNQSTWDWSLGEVIDYYLKPLQKPSFYGLMIGHTNEQITLPLGCNVRIDAGQGTLEILENCVI